MQDARTWTERISITAHAEIDDRPIYLMVPKVKKGRRQILMFIFPGP